MDKNGCFLSHELYRQKCLKQANIPIKFKRNATHFIPKQRFLFIYNYIHIQAKMQSIHSNKMLTLTHPSIRKRIRSVPISTKKSQPRMPQEEYMLRKLERGINRQLDIQQPLFIENSISLPLDPERIKIQNKLWKYFLARMQTVKQKVEKERLNFCEKELLSIKEEIYKKISFNKELIGKLQASIKAKHKQINCLFEEFKNEKIAQENINSLSKAKRRRVQDAAENNLSEKFSKIKENIEKVRVDIAKIEQELQQHQNSLCKIEEEWKSFLKHFLKEGYYFQNGVASILKEMIQVDYVPNKDDFPPFLDETSKKCLKMEYDKLKKELQISKNNRKTFTKSEQRSQSKWTMRSLILKENLQRIYEGTKGFMVDWLKNEGWKDQIGFPRIQSTKQAFNKNEIDWRLEQKKRLLLIQDKERYRKVRAVLFGSKVETIS